MIHRIRGPHFKTPDSRTSFRDDGFEGPRFETSDEFEDIVSRHRIRGSPFRDIGRIRGRRFETPDSRVPVSRHRTDSRMCFKQPRLRAWFQGAMSSPRATIRLKIHYYLMGNWTPVFCMTSQDLTTIPQMPAWNTWRMILMCWRSSPSVSEMKATQNEGRISRRTLQDNNFKQPRLRAWFQEAMSSPRAAIRLKNHYYLTGIEPQPSAWQARILPLYHRCLPEILEEWFWCVEGQAPQFQGELFKMLDRFSLLLSVLGRIWIRPKNLKSTESRIKEKAVIRPPKTLL